MSRFIPIAALGIACSAIIAATTPTLSNDTMSNDIVPNELTKNDSSFATPQRIAQADDASKQKSSEQAGGQEKGGDKKKDDNKESAQDKNKKELSKEEKMQARFPQPAKVGDLIGLPVLDGNSSTIGYVKQIVRTPEGRIKFIVPYASWFGWFPNKWFAESFRRPVPVPIEAVAMLGPQIAALDMDRTEFDRADAWKSGDGQPMLPNETIKVAIQRR